jgi:surface protein
MKNLDQYILESLKGYKPGAIKPKEQLPENCNEYFFDKEVNVDEIENLDTSNVTNMDKMFERATFSSNSLDLSGWDVSNVKFTTNMFTYCNTIKYLDLSNWNTQSLTSAYGMFYFCKNLEYLDLSGWDTSKVKNIDYMFSVCYNLTNIKFSSSFSSLGSNNAPIELNLRDCGKNKGYKLSDETYESMLTIYDRKKAGLDPMKILVNKNHNIPDGWKDKMEERGYLII